MDSTQELIKASDDLRFLRVFCVLHAKCVSMSAAQRTFGPWCSKLNTKKGGKGGNAKSGNSSSPRGAKDNNSYNTTSGGRDLVRLQERPMFQGSSSSYKNGNSSSRTSFYNGGRGGGGGGSGWYNNSGGVSSSVNKDNSFIAAAREKHNGEVWERLSGQCPPYVFRHRHDCRSYIKDYRERFTVGNVCRRARKAPVLGVDVPDPYKCKRKKRKQPWWVCIQRV
jgi:hypothetical protein